jgi:8-oxo-dGTP pyrophosphatase MutT (NUDIX family)
MTSISRCSGKLDIVTEPLFTIPAERLPPGFAETLDEPPHQIAEPKPAATVVLLRDGASELEVLLLKRHRSSGFVPGAYVFPGGRIDEEDADERLSAMCIAPERGGVLPHYWFGAVREVFEETGVLLARSQSGEWAADASSNEEMEQLRLNLMGNQANLYDVIAAQNLKIVLDDVVYFAHWITPVAEPRRYDTRFFAAALPDGRNVRPDAREMVDALWISPAEALRRFEARTLPMVFPTVRTLQDLAGFNSVQHTLDALRRRDVQPVMPRLVSTEDGVGIVID